MISPIARASASRQTDTSVTAGPTPKSPVSTEPTASLHDRFATPADDIFLTVIGEAIIDRINTRGDAPTIIEHVGGSPLNVAVGCARLGLDTRLVTHFGQDRHGSLISDHLAANGVETRIGGTSPTSTSTAFIGSDGSASYTFSLHWDISDAALLAMESIETSHHLHIGSIATMLMPGARTVHNLALEAREQTTISYDPNCRPAITPDHNFAREQTEHFVQLSDIVKASDEDVSWLYPKHSLEEVMDYWLSMGTSLIVITRGSLGPIALTQNSRVALPAHSTNVADTIGAGDSFMAALIAILSQLRLLGATRRDALNQIDQERLLAILHYATKASAITCSRQGSNPPTLEEIDAISAPISD